METDREVLLWFHQGLVHKYGENPYYDYMHRLRWIIRATPKNKMSRGKGVKELLNSPQDFKNHIKLTKFEQELCND